MLALQRTAGNRATTGVVRPVAQRVAIKDPTLTETLYNKSSASGQATASKYTLNPRYAMTRQGDRGVTVTVRIKFLSQKRNTVDPKSPGAPPNTPALGALLDYPAEIPANDPRVEWARKTAEGAVKNWNGRLELVGEERNLFSANTKKRLPVTFVSVAVFGPSEQADNQVIIHPASTVAGSPGQPIDAGNWYMSKGNYAGDDKVIAAHEYGHLLGIPDEYSQSNEQLNALIHQAAPGSAPSAQAALDRATVERMVLASLSTPLSDQLEWVMPTITDALRAQRPLLKQKMAAAAAAGVSSADIRESLRSQLELASDASLAPSIPAIVAFETIANFSAQAQGGQGVEVGFSAGALAGQIRDTYANALFDAEGRRVRVAGLGSVSIDVAGSVEATAAPGAANAGSAAGVATSTVGPIATPGLPAVVPNASLEGQLAGLPATWAAAGSQLETHITPDLFTARMLAILKSAAAAAAAPLPPGVVPPPKLASHQALFERAYRLVSNAASGAASQLAAELVRTTLAPVLKASVSDLEGRITAEVNRIMTTPPAGVAALGPADPNMAALVAGMKKTLDVDRAGTKGTGRDPLGSGVPAPDQDVTYSYQGMMGSNATRALRPDQFRPLVNKFNSKLTKLFEKSFHGEVK